MNNESSPTLVTTSDHAIEGIHIGDIQVMLGTLFLNGINHGDLNIHSGASAILRGEQHGNVIIGSMADVTVHGIIHGEVNLDFGALLTIEESAKVDCKIVNSGVVTLRGVFEGEITGTGMFQVEHNGHLIE